MSKDVLDEREFELINIVGARLGANQRDLSKMMDLSLGMTNMLLKRLVSKGYIRMQQINKRKMNYILTPKGFSEKMEKTLKYALKTINSFSLIKNECTRIVQSHIDEGCNKFYLYGNSDLIELVHMIFSQPEYQYCVVTLLQEMPEERLDGMLMVACEQDEDAYDYDGAYVDLVQELSKSNLLFIEKQVT